MAVVKVGVAAGEIAIKNERLNELIFTMQPATLNVEYGQSLDRQVRDAKRAEKIREVFE